MVINTLHSRYPEDVYNGTGSSLGNPWYLTTAAMAELFYLIIDDYQTYSGGIDVSSITIPFWNYFAPGYAYKAGSNFRRGSAQYNNMMDSLKGWADAFMRRVKYHTPSDGHLAEEFNRNTGLPQGAADLTWSYASIITAGIARANAMGQNNWLEKLAAL
jgi:glucoamylase